MSRALALLAVLTAVPLLRRAAARSRTQVHRTVPTRPAPHRLEGQTAATMTGDLTPDPAAAGGDP